jgi:hypothetical protein
MDRIVRSSKMDLENLKKVEVSVTMDQFVIRDPKESENEYRVRVWKSRELWDYVQLDWKEEDIDEEEYMMIKMLQMKHQVYRMDEGDIDKEVKDTIRFMESLDRSTREHEYVWSQMYIYYLTERKTEYKMEVGMKRCRI